MKDTRAGHEAENKVAAYLQSLGWKILDQNWKTRRCEIDIVAKYEDEVYFVEVKYRRSSLQGSGLEYITKTKLAQMAFAAELWIQQSNWTGNYKLAAIEVAGEAFEIGELITDF